MEDNAPHHYLDEKVAEAAKAASGEAPEYKVYTRRYFVAASLAIGYAMWNWAGNRHVILAKSYGQYYNQPFEFQLFTTGDPGIDFLTILGNAVLLVSYIPCAILVDKFGLRMMWLGNGGLAISTWIWYFSGPNINGAIASIIFGNLFGPLLSTSLLATSNKWFPENERGRATAAITITSLVGAGLSVLGPTVFGIELSADKIDLSLKSCNASLATLSSNETFCADVPSAVDDFCCAADADIPKYDLILAILVTLSAIFTVVSVRDRPPTPPSGGADIPNLPSLGPAFKHLFKWPDHQNFIFIMAADFLIGGPPKVLFAAIARILPPTVAEYDVIAVAVGFVFVVPFALIIARLLDKNKLYFPVVSGAFVFGYFCYILLMICLIAGTVEGEWAFLIIAIFAVIAVLAWQVGVFELKLEYVFTPDFSIEGLVLGTDRFVVNLASAVFLATLAPESVGRLGTFVYGSIIMTVGLIPLFAMKGKYNYVRYAYEQKLGIDLSPEILLPIENVAN